MKTRYALTVLCLSLLVLDPVLAETYSSFTNIVGVDSEGNGIVGNVTVEVQPGKGRVLVDTYPLQGIYTQNSERIAVKVTGEVTGFDFSGYDVIYTIMTPGAHVVEGPSAGGAMTLATIAAVEGREVSSGVAMTGTIEEDHSIEQVGAILTKAKAAADAGATIFLIPKGQAIQNQYVRRIKTPAPGWYIETIEPISVNVIDYAEENWNLDVREVSTIEEAVEYAFGEIPAREPIRDVERNVSLPQFSSPVKAYGEFSSMIDDTISRAEDNHEMASEELESADISDSIALQLGSILMESRSYLDGAKEAKEKGYEYSAGNEAFKSSISSRSLIDLIDYYSLSETERISFLRDKLSDVKRDLSEARDDIVPKTEIGICDPGEFEWAIAARQRLVYSENKVESLEASLLINPLESIYNMNVIEEWIEISRDFANSMDSANLTCLSEFEIEARKALEEAEEDVQAAKTLGVATADEAEWYLNAAKVGFSKGWYLTSIYDATSASVRAEVGSKYEGRDIDFVHSAFMEGEFVTESLLGTIYLEHSHFAIYNAIRRNSAQGAVEALALLKLSEALDHNYEEIKRSMIGTKISLPISVEDLKGNYDVVLLIAVGLIGLYAFNLNLKVKKLERRYKRYKRMKKRFRKS